MKILFFGDSITDCLRTSSANPDTSIGEGFVKRVAEYFEQNENGKHEIINRGISGHRIVDLLARYKKDCVNLNPDLVSILIGVNDVWHQVKYNNGTRIELFVEVYKIILREIKLALPNVKFIICEPFFLKGTATENIPENPTRYEQFKAVYDYAKAIEQIAKENDIPYVYLQDKLTDATKTQEPRFILGDGVHPVDDGKQIICDEWLKVFKKYYE